MVNTNEVVHLFITGGFDSTFMLCKMSRLPITIEPIYIYNEERLSREYEQRAIARIIQAIVKHPDTKASIVPIKNIELKTIKVDQSIIGARKRLMKKVGHIGKQYDYLATVAKSYGLVGLGLENLRGLGLEDGASLGGIDKLFINYIKLVPGPYGAKIDQDKSNPDVNLVFGNMFFPIWDITEPEMDKWSKKNGYDDIMRSTWFCHSPINGSPCGLCPPCEEKMGSKMEHLLPEEAKKRYYKAKKLSFLGSKLSRIIKRREINYLIRHNNKH